MNYKIRITFPTTRDEELRASLREILKGEWKISTSVLAVMSPRILWHCYVSVTDKEDAVRLMLFFEDCIDVTEPV